MLMSNEQGSKRAAQVDFTRSGWQQFAKLNRKLGARFIRRLALAHDAAGGGTHPAHCRQAGRSY